MLHIEISFFFYYFIAKILRQGYFIKFKKLWQNITHLRKALVFFVMNTPNKIPTTPHFFPHMKQGRFRGERTRLLKFYRPL
jgi:hypothetical protein